MTVCIVQRNSAKNVNDAMKKKYSIDLSESFQSENQETVRGRGGAIYKKVPLQNHRPMG